MNLNIYYFIDEFDKKEKKKLPSKISLIYRNYNTEIKSLELKSLIANCRKNRRKVYISNNLKVAIKFNFNGLYIPSFNRNLGFKNIARNNFEIIGSAHNITELKIKERQGCSSIFLSPIFKNDKKRKFLDVVKTNFLKNSTKRQIILLGGINFKTLSRSKLCAASGIAAISWIKKNGPSINTGPF